MILRTGKHTVFFGLWLLTVSTLISAQTDQQRPMGMPTSIHGQVRYARGGAQAENVLVRLESVSGGMVGETRTDRMGKFDFSNVGQAIYRVTATMQGYLPASREVNLTTSITEYVALTLVPESTGKTPFAAPGEETLIDVNIPTAAREEYEKGRADLLQNSDPAKGIPHLEKAVKIYPAYLDAQLLLGTAYLDSHQPEKAEKTLRQVLQINPKTSQALLALGEVYREKKNYSEAEKALNEGLKMDDAAWEGHLTLGRVYWETGDIPKAGIEVGRTLQLKPDCADADLLAGNILLRARKPQEAVRMFQEYLRLQPKGQYAEQTMEVVKKIKKALGEK